MGSLGTTKPHIVCVPFPAQGHVDPFMRLAKLLHSRGFHITFVNTEFNHRRLVRSKGPESVKGLPDFRFETIPDGMPPSDPDASQDIPMLCKSIRKHCVVPLKELLIKLNSSPGEPKVTCVISDGVITFGLKAAKDLGIPDIQLWTASACAMMGYLQYLELVKRGIVPFKDENYLTDGTLDEPVDWIPGMRNIRVKDLPSSIRVTDPNDFMFHYMGEEAHSCLTAQAIVFNIFDEIEYEILEAIKANFKCPNFYTIGPLPLLVKHLPAESQVKSLNSSLWKPDSTCIDWLNQREPDSVVYVNYGSLAVMSNKHFQEFAWGLANSKHSFLWIVRPDIVAGDSVNLPEEFFEEVKDRGLVVTWCAQEQVLAHPSVGAFLTHCGWNSMLETICAGKPVICWPFFLDQQTNCKYACDGWGMGLEINHDVKRDEVSALVKEMMGTAKGSKMRNRAKEWKNKAEAATEIGGSSYNNFDRFIEALHYEA